MEKWIGLLIHLLLIKCNLPLAKMSQAQSGGGELKQKNRSKLQYRKKENALK